MTNSVVCNMGYGLGLEARYNSAQPVRVGGKLKESTIEGWKPDIEIGVTQLDQASLKIINW